MTTMTRRACVAATLATAFALTVGMGTAFAYETLDSCNPYWRASTLPATYVVGQDPPSSIPNIDDIRRIFSASFAVWGEPCCSSFSARDGGVTSARGDDYYDRNNTLSFESEAWPDEPGFGDPRYVLAVTVPVYDRGSPCYIHSADILFNAVGATFIDGQPRNWGESDLQSIATHEIGHFLGLDHTPIPSATMYEAYDNGTSYRTLHQDDIDGVCFLYEQSCSCSSNAECTPPAQCIDSSCQVPPCGSDADCASGETCEAGVCVPPCPICGECSSDTDCGPSGICLPAGSLGAGTPSACTAFCTGFDCPGDSECFTVATDSGDVNLCFNPDADVAGPCPSSYLCDDGSVGPGPDPTPDAGGSPDAGGTPDAGTSSDGGLFPDVSAGRCGICQPCGSDVDCGGLTCLSTGGQLICSTQCNDGVCPGNSSCFALENASGVLENWCLNDNALSAGICSAGWECIDDTGSGGNPSNPGETGDRLPGEDDGDPGDPPSSCGGCRTGQAAGGPGLVLAALAGFGLVVLRRRRRLS